MQLVEYKMDPSGCGMLSKIGKFTSEKYSVFRKKDEILCGKPKYLRVSQFPQFQENINENEDDHSNELGLNQKPLLVDIDKIEAINQKRPVNSFDSYISRKEHFLNKQIENGKIAPPLGMYSPKQFYANVKV